MKSTTKQEVCITTYFGTWNYGSNLQAIALAKTIEKMGYQVYFLETFRVIPFMIQHPVLLMSRLVNRIHRKKSKRFFSPVPYSISEERKERLNSFYKNYFNTMSITTTKKWNDVRKRHVIFVAGSDIIWNPARGYPTKSFLDFAYYGKLKRFSYASSVGESKLPRKYFSAYRRYLGSMEAVSVRERSVVKMLEQIVDKKIQRVIDPTLLLTEKEWESFAEDACVSVPVDSSGYVLCYFVMNDPRYWDYVSKIKRETGLQIIVLPMHKLDEQQPYDIITDGTPKEFVWLINHSEFVCTDSLHACIISSIFNKEFYLLRRNRKAEDSKYNDFLKPYHLEQGIVEDEDCFVRKHVLNFTYSNEKIKSDAKHSMKYLADVLDRCRE